MSLDSELGHRHTPEGSSILTELCLHAKTLQSRVYDFFKGLALRGGLASTAFLCQHWVSHRLHARICSMYAWIEKCINKTGQAKLGLRVKPDYLLWLSFKCLKNVKLIPRGVCEDCRVLSAAVLPVNVTSTEK